MHVYPAKKSRFESTDFVSVMIDDVGPGVTVKFFRGFVPEVVVASYAVGFIYISGELGFVYFITAQFYDVRK